MIPLYNHSSPLDGGYTAVPWNGVTLNGIYLPQMLRSVSAGKDLAVIGPDNHALKNEAGGVQRYSTLDEAREDVATLRRILGEADTLLNQHNADRGCRCISLWQPWASLMACGAKHLETRPWNTKVRGRVCIHAAQTRTGILDLHNEACNPHDDTGLKLVVAMEKALDLPFGYWREKLPFGAIIAEGEIYDTATAAEGLTRFPDQEPFGDFSPGRFVHLYRNLKPITPIPFKGKQGFFFTRLP